MQNSDFIPIRAVAELLFSTPGSIYVMIHKKVFPADIYYRVGKRKILFSKSKLIAWITGQDKNNTS